VCVQNVDASVRNLDRPLPPGGERASPAGAEGYSAPMTEILARPTLEEIEAASKLLRSVLVPTPLIPLHAARGPLDIRLKPEIHQVIGSFKIRGVFNAVATLPEGRREAGVSTVSAGNTAQALAWSARALGISAKSLMPEGAPQTKIDAVRALGGEPVLVPMDELFTYMRERGWESEREAFIHPWTDHSVHVGHGTMGLEIYDDCPDVDSVYIPVGGGGLLAGVASALKALAPDIRIVAVEPEGCPTLHTSLAEGRPSGGRCETICDGVAVPFMTDSVFPLMQDLVDECRLVSEDDVKATMRRLASQDNMIVEPSGALATAAALADDSGKRGTAVALLTGGNIDMAKLLPILGGED